MTLAGRLHPLLIHFPIALVLFAAVAELYATATDRREWRVVAIGNLRAGAVFVVAAAVSGWLLASSPAVEPSQSLEYHRLLGSVAAIAVVGAALTTTMAGMHAPRASWLYRVGLFSTALLVGVAGHLGAVLVWGAHFLMRP
jgi:uncharacterized membrane protein